MLKVVFVIVLLLRPNSGYYDHYSFYVNHGQPQSLIKDQVDFNQWINGIFLATVFGALLYFLNLILGTIFGISKTKDDGGKVLSALGIYDYYGIPRIKRSLTDFFDPRRLNDGEKLSNNEKIAGRYDDEFGYCMLPNGAILISPITDVIAEILKKRYVEDGMK